MNLNNSGNTEFYNNIDKFNMDQSRHGRCDTIKKVHICPNTDPVWQIRPFPVLDGKLQCVAAYIKLITLHLYTAKLLFRKRA